MATGTATSSAWAYDARGRMLSVTENMAGMAARSFSWAYDSADRVVTQGFPAAGSAVAETLTYTYSLICECRLRMHHDRLSFVHAGTIKDTGKGTMACRISAIERIILDVAVPI